MGSSQGGGETLLDAGGDAETLPEAGGGAETSPEAGGDAETLPEAGDGAGGADEASVSTSGGKARQKKKPAGKRSVAQDASKLCVSKPSKHDSLIWRCGKEAVASILETLNANYQKAKAKLAEISENRTDPDHRTLTYKQIENALRDPNVFEAVAKKLETTISYTASRYEAGGRRGLK